MPTIDRKPPELPSLIAVAASLAREGRGAEAQAVKNAAALLARSACDGEDGARYQWLAANDWIDNFVMDTRGIEPRNKRTLDAAIDAARKGVGG
jgi:hypothetical protein